MSSAYGQDLTEARGSSASQQTDTVLVAAPNGNRRIAVAYVFGMADTQMTITFESGTSTLKWKLFPAARGGAGPTAPLGEYLFKCGPGESLTYTTSVAGDHYVHVLYGELP
jgi:hypothetical protein